jgi:glycosyltransferase involved in cell wall biosynthesis
MNASAPEVSCVIPAYENIDLLARCVASALAQTDVRCEVIVSDDSAGPAVRALVDALSAACPHLRYEQGPRSGNPVDNWNHGLERARGHVHVLLHHDEFLLDTGYLRKAADALSRDGVAAVLGRTRIVSPARPSRFATVAGLARLIGRPAWILPSFNWIGPTAAFAFRASHRFDPAYAWVVDVEFYQRVLATGRLVILDGAQVGSLGHHPAQITARIDPRAIARREVDRMARSASGRMGRWEHAFHRAVLALRTAGA